MKTYWADITVKVLAHDEEEAGAILDQAVNQMDENFAEQIAVKGIEFDADV